MDIGVDGRRHPFGPQMVPDRLWVPAAGGLALALLFAVALLVRAGGDVSLLVHAAPPWTDPARARPSLTVQPSEEGFDGQFFYRLGVSPWSTEKTVAGVTNDLPALRNARWGYGALAWAVSGGDPDLVPWSLLSVNLAAAAALGAIGGGLARSAGRHAAWGVLFVAWPGFAYSMSMDTSEMVASALALGGLLALRHRRWIPAGALLAAAVITRDTALVVAAGVAAGGLTWAMFSPGDPTGGDRRRADALRTTGAGAVGVATFVAWQLVQRSRFGELPLTSSGDNNLAAPFAGWFHQFVSTGPPDSAEAIFRLLCMAAVVALIVAAGSALRSRSESPPYTEAAAWCMAVAVVVLLNFYLWSGATAFMRATTEAGVLSILALLGSRRRHADRTLALAGACLFALWGLTAATQIAKLG